MAPLTVQAFLDFCHKAKAVHGRLGKRSLLEEFLRDLTFEDHVTALRFLNKLYKHTNVCWLKNERYIEWLPEEDSSAYLLSQLYRDVLALAANPRRGPPLPFFDDAMYKDVLTNELAVGLGEVLLMEVSNSLLPDGMTSRQIFLAPPEMLAAEQLAEVRTPATPMLPTAFEAGAGRFLAAWKAQEQPVYVEKKYDGIRVIADVLPDRVSLTARLGSETERVPNFIRDILLSVSKHVGNKRFVLDGELCHKEGLVALQRRGSERGAFFVVFDLLFLDGAADLVTYGERRRQLCTILAHFVHRDDQKYVFPARLLTTFVDPMGKEELLLRVERVVEECDEGAVLKLESSPYAEGRSHYWLKYKRVFTVDAVIVGYRNGSKHDHLLYKNFLVALRQGPGQDELTIISEPTGGVDFADRLEFERRETPDPRIVGSSKHKGVVWVEPTVVVELKYCPSVKNRPRHPNIIRIRDDKPVAEIDEVTALQAV